MLAEGMPEISGPTLIRNAFAKGSKFRCKIATSHGIIDESQLPGMLLLAWYAIPASDKAHGTAPGPPQFRSRRNRIFCDLPAGFYLADSYKPYPAESDEWEFTVEMCEEVNSALYRRENFAMPGAEVGFYGARLSSSSTCDLLQPEDFSAATRREP